MFTRPGLVSQLARRRLPEADWRWPCTCMPDGTDPSPCTEGAEPRYPALKPTTAHNRRAGPPGPM